MSSNQPSHPTQETSTSEQLVKKTQPWTDETVSLFWKYENTKERSDSFYFSYQCGPAIIMLAKEFGLLRGQVLDFSAARGYLSDLLLNEPEISVEAVEYTKEAVDALNDKFQKRDRWKQAKILPDWLQQESRQYDLIFCIEVIEHLVDPYLESTFEELYRSLAPGGSVIFTTPNEEPLQNHLAFCPFCRTEYHPVQHVRSFSAHSLKHSLEQAGFEVSYCQSINLNTLADSLDPNFWKKSRASYLKMRWKQWYCKIMDAIAPREKSRLVQWIEQEQGPNLLAVASKPTTG